MHGRNSFTESAPTIQPRELERRNWFAVFTRSHHEKRVVQHLTGKGIESFLPLYKAVHRWTHHRTAALDLPLFPNYLFIHIAPHQRIRTLEVPGVLTLVGCGNVPSALPDFEIESLRSGLSLRKFEPHPYLAAGAKVRIARGPFAGLEGVVLRTKGCLRVVLSMDFIAQSVAVEVDADELEQRCFLHRASPDRAAPEFEIELCQHDYGVNYPNLIDLTTQFPRTGLESESSSSL